MIPKFRAWDKAAELHFVNTTERYRHKPKGMLTNLYHKMATRNRKNGFGELPFTLDAFHEWTFEKEEFYIFFDAWVKSGYAKKFKPSVDRIDPNKGYRFSNMQWMFWFNNQQKGYKEVADKKKKPVLMYNENKLVGKFRSIDDARVFLGMKSNGNIVMVLRGQRKTVKGYTFKYENPELLKEDTAHG